MTKKIIMQLDTLTCPSCMTKIDQSLRKQAGVEDVKVLFNASKIKATVTDDITGDTLAQSVANLGYTVKTIKEKGK